MAIVRGKEQFNHEPIAEELGIFSFFLIDERELLLNRVQKSFQGVGPATCVSRTG